MTTINHTTREIFKILHKYARNEVNVRGAKSAYDAADRALDAYFHNFGYDAGIDRVIAISNAALWAVHWAKFGAQVKLPLWASERRTWFELDEDGSLHGYTAPRLP